MTRKETDKSSTACLSQIKEVDYVILHFADLLGLLKGRTIPKREADRVLSSGTGFDGSSIPGYVSIEESDMVMKPDPATLTVFPRYFYDRGVASFICDIYRPGGKRFESDPRYLCQKSVEKLRAEGYEPAAAAELEFYLVRKNNDGEICSVEEHIIDYQRYFDISPGRDLTEMYRMDLSDALSQMGLAVERCHHEVGSAQSEITFDYSAPVTTSDNIVRYKFAAKAVANRKYGWTATFMPKLWFGKTGSGMHVHLSLFSKAGKKNSFFDPNGYASVSQLCRYFVGGLLEHARALSAIVASTVNSYKRLVPGYEAPIYIMWSKRNRSAFLRVPEYFPREENEARVEFRCPDPLCNPYLAYAVLFEAGLDGIKKKIEPGDPIEENVYHFTDAKRKELGIQTLPTSLKEALDEWNNDEICVKAIGKGNAEKFLALKTEEWKEYEPHMPNNKNEVTLWELEKYLFA